MAIGPGKYDGWALRILQETDAQAVAVLVVGGRKGDGMAVKARHPAFVLTLPGMLRGLADLMESSGEVQSDFARGLGGEGVSEIDIQPPPHE